MFELFKDYQNRMSQFSANVKLYLLALAFNSIGVGMFQVLYNLYLKELQYDEAFVGQTISLKALAAVLVLIPAGIFSDKLGRRKAMITGALTSGVVYVLLSIFQSGNIILTFIFLNGLFNAFFMVAQSPFMMENTSPRERMHLFSINSALTMGAWMLGNILGGWLPDVLHTWFPLLTAMKITLFICSIIILLAAIPLFKIRELRAREERRFADILQVLTEKQELLTIGKFLLPSALVGFGAGLFVPYTNLYLANEFSMSSSLIGFILALSQVTTAVSTLLVPLAVKYLGKVKSILAFQLVSLPFLLVMATTSNLIFATAALLLRTTFMNSANPLTSNLMMEEVGENVKGIANSFSQMAFQLGWAVMGPISGLIITAYGYSYIFYLAMLFYLGSALSYYFFFRKIDERTSPGSLNI